MRSAEPIRNQPRSGAIRPGRVPVEDLPRRPFKRASWVDRVECGLGHEAGPAVRREAIPASLAALALRHPRLFKWAGMAALAADSATRRGAALNSPAGPDLDERIHDELAWAHAAYDGTDAGFQRIETLLSGVEHERVLDGFRMIERGRLGLDAADDRIRHRAEASVWRGNLQLLRYVQEMVVQPWLDAGTGAAERSLRAWWKAASRTDFDGFIERDRPDLLAEPGDRPNIARLEQRLAWLEEVVVPRYRALERDPARLAEELRAVAARS